MIPAADPNIAATLLGLTFIVLAPFAGLAMNHTMKAASAWSGRVADELRKP